MRRCISALAILFLLFVSSASAEPDLGSPSAVSVAPADLAGELPAPPMEDLVQGALEHSPSLAAQRAKLAAAREQVSPAGAFTDPMLELSGQEDFSKLAAPQFYSATLQLSQELPFPGKRGLRRDAASAAAEREAAELIRQERKLIADVRTVYARLYALDQERRILEMSRELLTMLQATAGARYSSGESDQEALLKAQLAVSRLMERIADLAAERAAMAAELNRLLDQPTDQPLGPVQKLPEIEMTKLPPEDAWSSIPDIAVQQKAIEAAGYRLDAAKREVWPDFKVGLGGGVQRNEVDNSFMPMGMLSFGVTLPIWQGSKQQPLIHAAEFEKQMAVAERRDAEAMVRATIVRLKAEWQRNERQIILYKEAILPQTHVTFEAARSSYLVGRSDFSTVLEDFNMWLAAHVELAQRESARIITWAELEALLPAETGGAAQSSP